MSLKTQIALWIDLATNSKFILLIKINLPAEFKNTDRIFTESAHWADLV